MGWFCADTCYLETQAVMDSKQILSLAIPCRINIHRSPDPKSSHPVFDEGVLIEFGGTSAQFGS
jgi:DNA-directed RNA polymerase II subunit RPB1